MPHKLFEPIITLGIALIAGLACNALNMPAPYLLGSLSGVWLAGVVIKPVRSRLEVPRWLVTVVIVGLGVVIGAIFTPDVMANAARWSITLIAVTVATVIATACGFIHLTRLRGYDKTLALLCCLPGGQAEVVAMSRELKEKDYVVAICHLLRIAIVFCSTPMLLALIYGQDVVDTSNAIAKNMPGVMQLPVFIQLQFVGIAITGYICAGLIRLPMPHLLGPLLLSATLHFLGLVNIPRIAEFMLLAQIVIGGSVGARLARVSAAELKGYLRDALVNAILIILIYSATAALLSLYIGASLPNTLLAFIPGGLYEVTLLTFLFGFDLAFVTFHHVFRVLLIYLSLPFIIARFGQTSTSEKNS